MVEEIRLPPLGQTSDEMSIVEWYKKEGDRIGIAEPLLCVETDKAQVDVESAEEGVVLKIVAQSGVSLASGALLAYVGQPGETVPDLDAAPAAASPDPDATAEGGPSVASAPPAVPAGGRATASPVVRKLAASLGVDLATVTGTGPGGRVERADVEAAAGRSSAASSSPAAPGRAEVSPIRRAIARRLTRSTQSIPQFALQADLDARAARDLLADAGIPGLTYTHLLLRALAATLRAHPAMTRVWVEDGPAYRTLGADVGLAVAGDDALHVVTIAEPDAASLADLVATVKAAADRGRAGNLSADDQRPAALSLSNLGMFGVDVFTAIVDPDQTAILAAGAVRDLVRAIEGRPEVVPVLSVTLSVDHRAADGAQAARFLADLRSAFEGVS